MIPASLRLLPGRRVCACGCACGCARVGACVAVRVNVGCWVWPGANTHVTPPPCVATSVIDVHTTNVCEYVNSLSSLERYSCVVNLGLFCFCFVFVF